MAISTCFYALRVYKGTFVNALQICYCNIVNMPHEEKCNLDELQTPKADAAWYDVRSGPQWCIQLEIQKK